MMSRLASAIWSDVAKLESEGMGGMEEVDDGVWEERRRVMEEGRIVW